MTPELNGIAPLSHLGVIRAQGDDAVKFLHGQLTHDFALLGMEQARLTAFLSAQGRMQASLIGFKRSPTEVLLVCSRDVLAATLKRLSMFVMRAKAKLSNASDEFSLFGVAGASITALGGNAQAAPWSKTDQGDAAAITTLIQLYPADGQPRALCVAPASAPAPVGPTLEVALWAWSEVRSGVVTLTAPLVDAFVPQMLNYESIGGVSFKKGCYPGQEVVARSQFRGTLKRRAYLAHAAAEIHVGAEVFTSDDLEQPCGTVVQVAAAPGGGWVAMVSMRVAAAEQGALQVGAGDGIALTLDTLPYTLVQEV